MKVRVRTCVENLSWRGYMITAGDSPELDRALPLKYGTTTIEMYPSHARELAKIAADSAATEEEISYAFRDFENDLIEVGAAKRGASREDLIKAARRVADGEIQGKTSRHYRPSFTASFQSANRREFPVIASVEIVTEKQEAQQHKR